MEAALVRQGQVRYREDEKLVINGKTKTRLGHLIDIFEDFKESYAKLDRSNTDDLMSRLERRREDMMDDYYKVICRSGLRKNLHRNEGIRLLSDCEREAMNGLRPPAYTHAQ